MPLQQPIANQFGDVYQQGHYVLDEVAIDKKKRQAVLRFNGYKDQEAYAIGKAVVIQKVYAVRGQEFDDFFSTAALEQSGNNLYKQGYIYAKQKKEYDAQGRDVCNVMIPTPGLVIPPAVRGYFDDAIDVNV